MSQILLPHIPEPQSHIVLSYVTIQQEYTKQDSIRHQSACTLIVDCQPLELLATHLFVCSCCLEAVQSSILLLNLTDPRQVHQQRPLEAVCAQERFWYILIMI